MSDLHPRLESLAGDDEWTRHRALESLRYDGLPAPEIHELGAALADPDATRRAAARMALAALASPGGAAHDVAQEALRSSLRSGAEDVRVLAASALGEAGDPSAGPVLVEALDDASSNVAAAVADALGELRYGPALEPLAERTRTGDFWVRAAAVVALGRLEDERAVPALARVAEEPGLEKPLVEALERINHPSALGPLKTVHATAPESALRAAGAILAAHPDLEPPAWVVQEAGRQEEALRYELVQKDAPAVARLLGLAGTDAAVDTLTALIGPPRRSEAAIAGLLAVPPERRATAVLDSLDPDDVQQTSTLLSLLPPVGDPDRVRRLVPFLSHDDESVRAAAAEALARAPAADALPLLATELDREGVAPQVILAMGALGEDACVSLVPLLGDPAPEVRSAAARALARCAGAAMEGDLRAALDSEDHPETRRALLRALARTAGARAMDALEEALDADDMDTRLAAIEALGLTGEEGAIRRLQRVLDRTPAERLAGIQALGDLAHPAILPVLQPYLDDEDLDLRRTAVRAAMRVPDALATDRVARLADDTDAWIRTCAARLLATRGADAGRRLQTMAQSDPDPDVRRTARQGLAGED